MESVGAAEQARSSHSELPAERQGGVGAEVAALAPERGAVKASSIAARASSSSPVPENQQLLFEFRDLSEPATPTGREDGTSYAVTEDRALQDGWTDVVRVVGRAAEDNDKEHTRTVVFNVEEGGGSQREEDDVGYRQCPPEFSTSLCLLGPPACILVLLIALIKASIVVVPTVVVMTVGTTGTAVGLFPFTVYRTYRAIYRTRELRTSPKGVAMVLVTVPLFLWPFLVLGGSACTSVLYGFFAPQLATFEAVRRKPNQGRTMQILKAGIRDTLEGAATVVRDFADFCAHSYPDYLEDFEKRPRSLKPPTQIRLLLIPGCIAVAVLGTVVDSILISVIAALKSLLFIYRGWQQLVCYSVDREGPCQEGVCLPVAFLAMVAWPALVILFVVVACVSSPFVGLYAGVVAYKENSVRAGASYTLAVAAEFDEQINELLEVGSTSCLPKPVYRNKASRREAKEALAQSTAGRQLSTRSAPEWQPMEKGGGGSSSTSESGKRSRKGVLGQIATSKSVRESLEETRIAQVWSSIFHQAWLHGQEVCDQGVLETADMEDWVAARKTLGSAIAGEGLVGLVLLRTLQVSHKEGSRGLLLLSDGLEILPSNRPRDLIFDWFFEPLVELKDQLAAAQLADDEERYAEAYVLAQDQQGLLDRWLGKARVPADNKRKAEIDSFGRRLLGMAKSITRFPTFRRRHQDVVEELLRYMQGADEHFHGRRFFKSMSEPGPSSVSGADMV